MNYNSYRCKTRQSDSIHIVCNALPYRWLHHVASWNDNFSRHKKLWYATKRLTTMLFIRYPQWRQSV